MTARPQYTTLTAGDSHPLHKGLLQDAHSQLVTDQAGPFTEKELAEHRRIRAVFWAEPDFPRTDYLTNSLQTSIAACAKVGSKTLIGFLAANGADEAGWESHCGKIPCASTASYLVVDTPLHVAVAVEDVTILQFLLSCGHKPDIFPRGLVTRCMNAVMSTITRTNPWLRGFDILALHSDLTLRTPIFGCQILHHAVGTSNLDVTKHVLTAMGGLQVIN